MSFETLKAICTFKFKPPNVKDFLKHTDACHKELEKQIKEVEKKEGMTLNGDADWMRPEEGKK
jgi:hypothetical protein